MNFKENVTKTFIKSCTKIKKYSPEILVISGIVGTIASGVLACKATLKVSDIVDDAKDNLEKINSTINSDDIDITQYSEQDATKDKSIVYIQTGAKLAKLYSPSIILGTLSIAAILTSNNILRQRNIAIAAAYTAIDNSFKAYRNRVIDRFGENVDKELKYGVTKKKIDEVYIDEETGKEKKRKVTADVIGEDFAEYSCYARIFDDASPNWDKDAEYNLMFLKSQQNWANDRLHSCGHIFLNEVYDQLGIPRTRAGQTVGWFYDPDDDSRDNYVDFGIYDIRRAVTRDFVNGYEKCIVLDFNVDGVIVDKI